ncbi:MAG: hypothetical protein ABJL99_22185 [Aliishimia sp.]
MKRTLSHIIMATIVLSTGASAAPYCADLMVQDQLPKKYQKRGPFFSDDATGWIIGNDQLKDKYAVTDEAKLLWRSIKSEFDKYGVDLVVMAAPPRPLFATDDAIQAMGLPSDADLSRLQQGFSAYIKALNAAGIVAPDFSVIAQSADAQGYYFSRDTHWTPTGAALSVAHLNAAMGKASAQDSMARIKTTARYEEKGSLAGVVKDVCGSRPEIETVSAPVYAQQGTASSLLNDVPDKEKIALVGTSFSDRYQRDAYQVADALAFVMDASVDNLAVTGGGLVGSMEAFIRSGALANTGYQTVVWETPYSAPLTQISGLRQILGALLASRKTTQISTLETRIGKDWVSVDHNISLTDIRGLEIEADQADTGQLIVELIDTNGGKSRTKLVKTDRVVADKRSPKWALAVSALQKSQIVRIKLRMPKASTQEPVTIRFFN